MVKKTVKSASARKPVAQAAATVVRNDNTEWDAALTDAKRMLGKDDDTSWKRVICSHIVSMFAAVGGAYAGLAITELLLAGVMTLGASVWLGFAVLVLGWLAAFTLSFYVSRIAFSYICSKRIDQHASFASERVRRFLSFSDEVAA